MGGEGRGDAQADRFSGEGRNEIQCVCMERLRRQNQRSLIFFGKRTCRLPEKQSIVRPVELIPQQGVSQGEQSGPDLMKSPRMRDTFHQTQPAVGSQQTEIGFGGLELPGITIRSFPVKFSFFCYGAARIGPEKSVRPDLLGK